jgi:hypothetical protein
MKERTFNRHTWHTKLGSMPEMDHGMDEPSEEAVEHAWLARTPVGFVAKYKVFQRSSQAMLLNLVIEESHVRVVIAVCKGSRLVAWVCGINTYSSFPRNFVQFSRVMASGDL